MFTLHVFFTFLLFLPIWVLSDAVLHSKSAVINIAYMLGIFFLSSGLVAAVSRTFET